MAHNQNRPVCQQVQEDTYSVCVPSGGKGSLGSELSEHIMGGHGRIRLSPNSHNRKCHKQDPHSRLPSNNNQSPGLAQHVMVLGSGEPVNSDSSLPTLPTHLLTQPFNRRLHHENLTRQFSQA